MNIGIFRKARQINLQKTCVQFNTVPTGIIAPYTLHLDIISLAIKVLGVLPTKNRT